MKQSLAAALLVLSLAAPAAGWKLTAKATLPLRTKEVRLHDIAHRHLDPFQQFPESFPLQVAVFWTRPDPDPENPLALVHSLKEMGIPFLALNRNL